jgi:hypothetical protein
MQRPDHSAGYREKILKSAPWVVGDPMLTSLTVESLEARIELTTIVRRLVDRMASSSAGATTLGTASKLIEQAVALLEEGPHRRGYVRAVESVLTGLGPHGELGPFTGALHVFSPFFTVQTSGELADRKVTGVAIYGNAYEGVPGLVQGGFIVATFDEILGLAQGGFGRMTADIQVSYRAPAPLHRELRYSAQVVRVDGRKAFVEGALYDGDTLCATARGLFISPKASTPCG